MRCVKFIKILLIKHFAYWEKVEVKLNPSIFEMGIQGLAGKMILSMNIVFPPTV
jgi:ribosomal protein L31E